MLDIWVSAFFLSLFIAVAMRCAGISFIETTRKTFAPLTKNEFLFPPCAYCWAARAAALLLIFCIVDHFVYQF